MAKRHLDFVCNGEVHGINMDPCKKSLGMNGLNLKRKPRPTCFQKTKRRGFLDFQASHASLCESKTSTSGSSKCPPLTSMSQPCMPVSNVGPTKVLPFLYLGSQKDALSPDVMKANGITYILNVSTTSPQPGFIQDGHFLRIPVNDNYSDKLLPFFQDAFQFLDKVREANGCALVHCLAGISRSPTLAIAYIMKYLNMSSDDAYRYVKDKRPTISPNFNFLGQLLDYEKQLKQESRTSPETTAALKRQCIAELRSPTSPTVATPKTGFGQHVRDIKLNAQSPTTALAKLSFASASPSNTPTKDTAEFPQFPGVPTASLDRLSFVPCSVKDDIAIPNEAKSSGGTKRPHSFSTIEKSKTKPCTLPVSLNAIENSVTIRSPDFKAKRPLVRPNSIAFSSYPKFEMLKEMSPAESRDNIATAKESKSVEVVCLDNNNDNGPAFKENSVIRETLVSGNLEQNRKSRSYEDILSSPYEDGKCATCNSLSKNGHQKMTNFAEAFSPQVTLEGCRCRGTSDPHQSNSSISSSGSHNSLHGSLEMIPVS